MRIVAAGLTVVFAIVGLFAVRPGAVVRLDDKVCDVVTGWGDPGSPSGRVAIVDIDDASLHEFGRWPWSRNLMARLTRLTFERGAALVVLDVMFPEPGAGDDELAKALAQGRAVAGFTFGPGKTDSQAWGVSPLPLVVVGPSGARQRAIIQANAALWSVPQLSRAATGNGFLTANPDSDGTMRRIPLVIEYGGAQYPSLALAAIRASTTPSSMQLELAGRRATRLRLGAREIPLEGASVMRLRFRGPRRTFPYIAASAILTGHPPSADLRGKIVVIGGSAAGVENPMVTPVDPMMPGVEIQATAIDNLLRGDFLSRPVSTRVWELFLALLGGLTSTLLLARGRSMWGTAATAGIAGAAWAGSASLLSFTGVLVSPLPLTAVLVCSYPLLTLLNYLREKRHAERTERQLESARESSRVALAESELRYRRLVENVNDAIITADIEGRLTFANRRFREWFGWENRDIREVVLEDCVAPEWRQRICERHQMHIRGETVPEHYEFEAIRPDGSRIWLESLVTAVEEEGKITGTQAALRDVTERKKMEAQYLQAQKMESVGRLAGGVAHDFNNLLTVINGYSEMLLAQMKPDDPNRSSIEQIRIAGDHAAELTQKLLAFSRKQLAQPKVLDPNLVVTDSQKMFMRLIGEDIELVTRLHPSVGKVMADPGLLSQVLMNLVVNARDAMPDGGKLIIETKNVTIEESPARQHLEPPAGRYVYLGVGDTGVGMTDEVKRHLFEPFFTTKEVGRGTGLGLATIYGIVRQSGGWIRVTSELGRGTTFHIYLPRVEAGAVEEAGAGGSAASLRGTETVLVVEDQEAVRRLVCTALERYGYRVFQAAQGPDAIALAEQYPSDIHLLVTDVVLPAMNGRVLAEQLLKLRPRMKVLYISGYTEETLGHSGVLDSGLAYLPKPFGPETLAAKVRAVLGMRQSPPHVAGTLAD